MMALPGAIMLCLHHAWFPLRLKDESGGWSLGSQEAALTGGAFGFRAGGGSALSAKILVQIPGG